MQSRLVRLFTTSAFGGMYLEAVVPFSDAADMLAPITDWVFAVDTLSEAQREESAAYNSKVRRWAESQRARPAEPGAAPDRRGV